MRMEGMHLLMKQPIQIQKDSTFVSYIQMGIKWMIEDWNTHKATCTKDKLVVGSFIPNINPILKWNRSKYAIFSIYTWDIALSRYSLTLVTYSLVLRWSPYMKNLNRI